MSGPYLLLRTSKNRALVLLTRNHPDIDIAAGRGVTNWLTKSSRIFQINRSETVDLHAINQSLRIECVQPMQVVPVDGCSQHVVSPATQHAKAVLQTLHCVEKMFQTSYVDKRAVLLMFRSRDRQVHVIAKVGSPIKQIKR